MQALVHFYVLNDLVLDVLLDGLPLFVQFVLQVIQHYDIGDFFLILFFFQYVIRVLSLLLVILQHLDISIYIAVYVLLVFSKVPLREYL